MKTLALVLIGMAAVAGGGCKKKGGAGDAVAKMTAFKERMCACKDQPCAAKVSEDMAAYTNEAAKAAGSKPQAMSADDAKKLGDVTQQLAACASTAMMAGTPTMGSAATGSDSATGSAAMGSGSATGSAAAGSGSAAGSAVAAGSGSAGGVDCATGIPSFVLGYIGVNTSRDNVEENTVLHKPDKADCKDVETGGTKHKRCTLTWSKPGAIMAIFEQDGDDERARYITTSVANNDLTTNESVAVGNPLSAAKAVYGDCLKQEGNVWSVRENADADAAIMEFTVEGDVIKTITLRGINEKP